MLDAVCFWWRCVLEGWHIGHRAFAFIEGTCVIVLAIAHWHRPTEEWVKHHKPEGTVMKWAALVLGVSFVLSTLFIAPYLQWKEANRAKEDAENRLRLQVSQEKQQSPVYQRQSVAKHHLQAFGNRCLALADDMDKSPRMVATAQWELRTRLSEVFKELTDEGIDTGRIGETASEQGQPEMIGGAGWRKIGQEALRVSKTFPK